MARPTIRDVADAAGVSVSTVNRVLGGSAGVREPTAQLVKETAERIGFYGLGAVRSQLNARRARYMTLETISQMTDDPLVSLPAVAS